MGCFISNSFVSIHEETRAEFARIHFTSVLPMSLRVLCSHPVLCSVLAKYLKFMSIPIIKNYIQRVYLSGFGARRTLLDVSLILSLADQRAHASTFGCVRLCSEGKILRFPYPSPLTLTFVRGEFFEGSQCNRFVFLHYSTTRCVPSVFPGIFLYEQLCTLPHWFTCGVRADFAGPETVCSQLPLSVFALPLQLALPCTYFAARYIRSLALQSVTFCSFPMRSPMDY